MKYPSNCVYIDKRGNKVPVNTAVDGILKVLKHRGGSAIIEIKVRRREALYMYVNQILTGIAANINKFKGYIPTDIDFIKYVKDLINNNILDMTEGYKNKTKDKQAIGYYIVELSIENFMF